MLSLDVTKTVSHYNFASYNILYKINDSLNDKWEVKNAKMASMHV